MATGTAGGPRPLSYDEQQADLLRRTAAVLRQAPMADRALIAQQQLTPHYPSLALFFRSIPKEQLAKTVLFVSTQPHMRETRLAVAARLAGWDPVLVHLEPAKYNPASLFRFHQKVDNLPALALATWLFPGPLQHVFALRGDHAYVFASIKTTRMILDLYDTGAGMKGVSVECHALEREALRQSDAITHRDLRIRYLQKHYGYEIPAAGMLLHDPLVKLPANLPTRKPDGEIRVVSTGWIGEGDSSALRVARALCAGGVHLHVYFNPLQNPRDANLAEYDKLAKASPYFHIEKQVFGDDYWRQLGRYDFGLSINERDIFGERYADYTPDYIAGCGSSRLMDYVQRGLGVIISPGLKFQSLLARHYAPTTVTATSAFLADPKPALVEALARRRERSLDSITVEGAAKRLGRLYDAVASVPLSVPAAATN